MPSAPPTASRFPSEGENATALMARPIVNTNEPTPSGGLIHTRTVLSPEPEASMAGFVGWKQREKTMPV